MCFVYVKIALHINHISFICIFREDGTGVSAGLQNR